MGDFHTTSMCRFMVATQAALRPLNAAPAATRHRRMHSLCRVNIEAFEKWARTIIDSELTKNLGVNYFDLELAPNVPVVKRSSTSWPARAKRWNERPAPSS